VPTLRSHLLDNNTEGIIHMVKSIADYAKQHEETVDPMVEEGAIQVLSNVLAADHPADLMYVPARPPPARLSLSPPRGFLPSHIRMGHRCRRLAAWSTRTDARMCTGGHAIFVSHRLQPGGWGEGCRARALLENIRKQRRWHARRLLKPSQSDSLTRPHTVSSAPRPLPHRRHIQPPSWAVFVGLGF